MSDDKHAPEPDEIGGTGSVAAGSRQRPAPTSAWGTKNGAQPVGQAPSDEDEFGDQGVGGPGPGSAV